MGNDINKRTAYSRYSAMALIVLSVVGIAGSLFKTTSTEAVFSVIVPYALTLLFGIAMALGRDWAKFPLLAISFAGIALNTSEALELPNQKDIAEVILFSLVVLLIGLDMLIVDRRRRTQAN